MFEFSPEEDAAFAESHAAEEAIAVAAIARDRSALLAGAGAHVAAHAKLQAIYQSKRAARGEKFVDEAWGVWIEDALGAFLLTDPVARAAEIRAALRLGPDEDPPETLLSTMPEETWPSHHLVELLVLRMLEGDWRPVVDLERRSMWKSGKFLNRELEPNRVNDALGRRDPDDAREAILRLARIVPRFDKRPFSLLAYALFQEARNLGMTIQPPKAYDFLGEPDPRRAREVIDRAPVSMSSLSVRDWVASCVGVEPAALGEPEIETDPGFQVTFRENPAGPFVARVLAIPDTEGQLGRIWRLAVKSPRGYYSLAVAVDRLAIGVDPAASGVDEPTSQRKRRS